MRNQIYSYGSVLPWFTWFLLRVAQYKTQTNNATKKRWQPKTKMTEDIWWKDHEYYNTNLPNYGGSKKNRQQQKRNEKSMRKNRRWTRREIEGKIKVKELVTLKQKKVQMLRREGWKEEERIKLKTQKKKDQGKFYEHLRTILSCHTDTDILQCQDFENAKKKDISSLQKEDFEDFWIPVWQHKHEEDLGNADGVLESREPLRSPRPEQQETPIVVTDEMVSKGLRKKKNWLSPGLNKITNHWLRLLSPIHHSLAIVITRVINSKLNNTVSIVPVWMLQGQTVMTPKKEKPTSAQEFRPITCPNTTCKLHFTDQQQITTLSVQSYAIRPERRSERFHGMHWQPLHR